MENNEYKNEIKETRKGSLGGSDGNILAQVASLGYVPKSAYKRIAIMKGLIEREDISTLAMRYGDFIEQSIYEHLKSVDDRYQSNPLWISGRYSKDGVRLICHPDFVLFDEEKKVLRVYECKATKYNHNATRITYQNQLYIEYTIAEEIVKEKGEGWKVEIYLCHYDTSNEDIEDGFVFSVDNLHIYKLRIKHNLFDIAKAMTIINDFLETFDTYYEGDEVDADMLPQQVRTQFDEVATFLKEIKEREEKVDAFRRKLYDFMLEKDIRSIKCDAFSITRVDETIQKSFDFKRFLEDERAKHPRKTHTLEVKYEKETKKKGYALIKVNKNKDIEDIFK